MGAPLNHLQQLTGHSPTRYIGTDTQKNFFFEIATPPFGVDLDIDVKAIDYDYSFVKAQVVSGSFTPAVQEAWDFKSFCSGNERGELIDYHPISTRITGFPTGVLWDVPQFRMDTSGTVTGIALESGYIQFSKWRGHLEPFWQTTGVIAQSFSGTVTPYNSDPIRNINYLFMTGSIYPEEAPHVPSELHFSAAEDLPVEISYTFLRGIFQGGQ
tara:strand:+ start:2151 stop:2789 length:639 start_codon:yes stop_codon:yes gene_type:complete